VIEVLTEIEAAIDKVDNWSRDIRGHQDPDVRHHDARFFRGSHEAWTFTVCDFSIEAQGFPKGSRGYDGAAAKPGMAVHLTRELAERAVLRAAAVPGGCKRCGKPLAYAGAIYCGAGCAARDGA